MFSFLTTAPNGVLAPVHPKAMPVLLLNEAAQKTWMIGGIEDALALQKTALDSAVRIVASGAKQDGA